MTITQNPYTFIINKDFNINAISKIKEYTVTIIQSSNQTIKVVCDGKEYTDTFTAPYGSTYTVSIIPDIGYNVGKLNNTGGALTENISISATEASIKQFTITIIQSKNQTIKVTCNETAHTSSFTANYGSTYTTTVTPNTGYNAGTLNHTSGTVTGDLTISATAATIYCNYNTISKSDYYS